MELRYSLSSHSLLSFILLFSLSSSTILASIARMPLLTFGPYASATDIARSQIARCLDAINNASLVSYNSIGVSPYLRVSPFKKSILYQHTVVAITAERV